MNPTRIATAALALAASIAAAASADDVRWKKHDINPKSVFEGAGVLDVDNDGKLDIVSGESWYNAPDWTKYPVRKVEKVGSYRNDFATMPVDVNADGNIDFVTVSYFGRDIGWVENPGKKGAEWTYHLIDKPGSSEAAVMLDVDGDGKLDFLPNSTNVVVWYSLETAGSKPVFKKHDFGTAAAGHGVGTGDVNGDGRADLLTPKGWFEAPSDPKTEGTWTKAPIDETLSSVHTLLWADLDGDGKANEMITGKRVYAHEIEAGDVQAPVIAYFTFDQAGKKWDKHLIYQGEPAKDAPKEGGKRDAQKDFAPGTAGTGLEIAAVDIDKDGDIDLVCPGKSGLYLFENLTKSK